jgi:hypothetical protein
MDSPVNQLGETRTANVKLSIGGNSIEMQLSVPAGPVRPAQLLPVLQSLTNAVVEIATDAVEAEGKRISCQAGCGACCRQLVPISEVEAGHIAELVENLPEPVKISRGLLRFELSAGQRVVDWVPLSLAPRWAKSHPPGPPRYTGPELVQEIFQHLTGQNTAPAESPRNDS